MLINLSKSLSSSYLVLAAGFYYAPRTDDMDDADEPGLFKSTSIQEFASLTFWEYARWYLTSR